MAQGRADALATVTFSGWFIKLGQKRPTWKKRFFVLTTSGNLTYFDTDRYLSHKPKGELQLAEDVTLYMGASAHLDRDWPRDAHANARLLLDCGTRKLYFYASSQQEADRFCVHAASFVAVHHGDRQPDHISAHWEVE